MQPVNWKTDSIHDILPEEFYNLIAKNREHLRKTFPVTASGCDDLVKTKAFIATAAATEKNKNGYYFYLRNVDTRNLNRLHLHQKYKHPCFQMRTRLFYRPGF